MNVVRGSLSDKSYVLSQKKRILRVRSTDHYEFRITPVSINSVRAALTISIVSSVRALERSRIVRGHKCRRAQILLMCLGAGLFFQRIGILRTLPTMFKSLNPTAHVKNITSNYWIPDIYVHDTTRFFYFCCFFEYHHLGRFFFLELDCSIMRAYTEHFLTQKCTCWKYTNIFKGIVLLQVNTKKRSTLFWYTWKKNNFEIAFYPKSWSI